MNKKIIKIYTFAILSLIVTCALVYLDFIKKDYNDNVFKGHGTKDDPYKLYDINDLITFSNNVNNGKSYKDKYIELKNDIDISQCKENILPIGTIYSPFQGNFDGNKHKISNIEINNSNSNYLGLFGIVEEGSISNLNLDNVKIKANSYIGAVVGNIHNGSIINCFSTGSIEGKNCISGICGISRNSNLLYNYNYSQVTGFDSVGGIVGYSDSSKIKNCFNNEKIYGLEFIGGIIGYSDYSTLENCNNRANISEKTRVGGISSNNNSGLLLNCTNSNTVYGQSYVSGITSINNAGEINTCSNKGKIYGNKYTGTIIGYNVNDKYKNIFNTDIINNNYSKKDLIDLDKN